MRFLHNKGFAVLHGHLVDYPTPVVGYISSFGSLAGLCLLIQIVTGVLLVAHYTPHTLFAFLSIEHIMRDVNDGWLLRYYHSNGASMFFLCLYFHIYHNHKSQASFILWASGVGIYILVMAAAFMGYILPWGQMSFWGATVITNLFSAIPYVGTDLAQWLWGGFSVDNPTLNRFFSFHYLVPFLIVAAVVLHLSLLHLDESTTSNREYVDFYYYYFTKDIFAFFIYSCLFAYMVFYSPNHISHPDNYTAAAPNVTPAHLVPEWYFLPFYAVLRATPDKFGGLILMFLTLVYFFLIDFHDSNEISYTFDTLEEPEGSVVFELKAGTLLILFTLGRKDIDEPYTDFAIFLLILQLTDEMTFEAEQEEENFFSK